MFVRCRVPAGEQGRGDSLFVYRIVGPRLDLPALVGQPAVHQPVVGFLLDPLDRAARHRALAALVRERHFPREWQGQVTGRGSATSLTRTHAGDDRTVAVLNGSGMLLGDFGRRSLSFEYSLAPGIDAVGLFAAHPQLVLELLDEVAKGADRSLGELLHSTLDRATARRRGVHLPVCWSGTLTVPGRLVPGANGRQYNDVAEVAETDLVAVIRTLQAALAARDPAGRNRRRGGVTGTGRFRTSPGRSR